MFYSKQSALEINKTNLLLLNKKLEFTLFFKSLQFSYIKDQIASLQVSVNKCNSKITPTFIQSCYRFLRRILCSCSFEYELVTPDLERSNQILHFLVLHLVLRKHFQSCTYPIQSFDHQHGHRAAFTVAEILVERFHYADVQPISN